MTVLVPRDDAERVVLVTVDLGQKAQLVFAQRDLRREEALIARVFPELCEAVAPFTGEEQAPARAAGLLRAMVEGGMIAGFRY